MGKLQIPGKLVAMALALASIAALCMLPSANSAVKYVINSTSGRLDAPFPGGAYIIYSATYYSYYGKPFVDVYTTLYCPVGIPKAAAYTIIRSESPVPTESTEIYNVAMGDHNTFVRSYGYTYRGTIEWGCGEWLLSGGLEGWTGYNRVTWRYR